MEQSHSFHQEHAVDAREFPADGRFRQLLSRAAFIVTMMTIANSLNSPLDTGDRFARWVSFGRNAGIAPSASPIASNALCR